jgi:hypothetical protein
MAYKILYAGSMMQGGTCLYRAHCLRRLGQEVIPFDTNAFLFTPGLARRLQCRFPAGPLIARVNQALRRVAEESRPDLLWLDKPVFFTPATIAAIRRGGAYTVCYNQDNPFGPRRDPGWMQFRRIYRQLDLHCLFRTADQPRYEGWKLNHIPIQLSYDLAVHFPPPTDWSVAEQTRAVSYIGSPYEERPQFLRTLATQYGIPVAIAGPRWDRFLNPAELKQFAWQGELLEREYRETIWRSRINLAFVTRLNEEDVAHKAFEITACGGFLLALRTTGHRSSFEEGKEAEFFSSVEECAAKCRYYLDHPEERKAIARRGQLRALSSGYDNDTQLRRVLERVQRELKNKY